jgi:hypothetical protein
VLSLSLSLSFNTKKNKKNKKNNTLTLAEVTLSLADALTTLCTLPPAPQKRIDFDECKKEEKRRERKKEFRVSRV